MKEETKGQDKMQWWRDSRFGLFVHWGIYSLKAKGEWVMYREQIPVQTYEKLAESFNPVQFDADAWVRLAKEAGMKYIVITAKHHDGFSMFKTQVSSFNIVDGTPFGRDVMAELAASCQREGLRLCFYYSHVREWRHPHAQSLEAQAPNRYGNYGNYWDYPDERQKNLQIYIDTFDKPQLKELLTQYGPIGIIWFDTPSLIRPDQAQELADLVHQYQPDCLVNSRVGLCPGVDYHSLGDCEIPTDSTGIDWETPMTICNWWGYNAMENNRYRSVGELIHQLVDVTSQGGNYLLNVGPDATGTIPGEAQDRLRSIGAWMQINQDSIYGTKASPFHTKPSWGRVTAKESRLYLHVYNWPSRITLSGLKNQVCHAYLLADPDRNLTWTQHPSDSGDYTQVTIDLPGSAPDEQDSVVCLELDRDAAVESRILSDDQGVFKLTAGQATIGSEAGAPLASQTLTGLVKNWKSPHDWFSWDICNEQPGSFDLAINFQSLYHELWDLGHEVSVSIGGEQVDCQISETGGETPAGNTRSYSGWRISIPEKGPCTVTMRARNIATKNQQGLQLSSLVLTPAGPSGTR